MVILNEVINDKDNSIPLLGCSDVDASSSRAQVVTKWSVDSGCHKLSENIWLVWSDRSYLGEKVGCHLCGRQKCEDKARILVTEFAITFILIIPANIIIISIFSPHLEHPLICTPFANPRDRLRSKPRINPFLSLRPSSAFVMQSFNPP